jgi:hypothetical protein
MAHSVLIKHIEEEEFDILRGLYNPKLEQNI